MATLVVTRTAVAFPTASFTRPADTTAYAVGDLVANSTTATNVVPLEWTVPHGSFYAVGVLLRKTKASVTNAQFRTHLYKGLPTFVTGGDNSAFGTVVATGNAHWFGSYDVTMAALHADGASDISVPYSGLLTPTRLTTGQTVRGLIEALAAYTPASQEVFTAELLLEQN